MPKKTERGPFGIFQQPSVAKHPKVEGGPFGENFFSKNSHIRNSSRKGLTMPKKNKGDSLVYPGMICYAEKSHYNSRVSLHEAPTKKEGNLKKFHICDNQPKNYKFFRTFQHFSN